MRNVFVSVSILSAVLAIVVTRALAGGVVNGQPVNATVTNAAFLYKNDNDTSIYSYTVGGLTSLGSSTSSITIQSSNNGVAGVAQSRLSLLGANSSGTSKEHARVSASPGQTSTNAGQLIFSTNDSASSLQQRGLFDENGSFAIGTTTPNPESGVLLPYFTVQGATHDAAMILSGGRTDAAGAGVAQFQFQQSSQTTNKTVANFTVETEGATANNRGGRMLFFTKINGGALTEAMRIDSSQNVGIGGAPSFTLDAQASTATTRTFSNGAGTTVTNKLQNTGGSFYLAIDNSSGSNYSGGAYNTNLWNAINSPLNFATNNAVKMTIPAGVTAPFLNNTTTQSLLITGGTAQRMEQANISCSTSSSIQEQSGSWISSIDNRSATTTACCVLTLTASIFGAVPVCTATLQVNSSPTEYLSAQANSSSSVKICKSGNSDFVANVMCMGAK